jgi:hypothetical protein
MPKLGVSKEMKFQLQTKAAVLRASTVLKQFRQLETGMMGFTGVKPSDGQWALRFKPLRRLQQAGLFHSASGPGHVATASQISTGKTQFE